MRTILFTAALVCLLPWISAQSGQAQPKRVLLAYEQTGFKSGLIKEMTALLKKEAVVVTVVEHSKGALDKEDASGYDAIFISNSGVQSMVRPWISQWISRQQDAAPKIILHTTQTRDWKVETTVDAVTSASSRKDTGKLAQEYSARIMKLLQSPAAGPEVDEE